MKNKLIIVFVHFIFGMNLLFAQSDYEIVQNFKNQSRQIEQSIRDADSLAALNEIEETMDKLRSDFLANKELLDKSLYPDNFDRSIERLRNSYTLRRGDFTQIDVLQTEVTGLKEQVDTLNRRNSELAEQFALLESQSKEDRSRIAQLEKTIASLRTALQKRDQIVMNMIDSLLPPSYRDGADLTPREKQEVISEAEQNNILYHIRRAVNDNIRFLEATKLYPDDIEDIKDQQDDFAQIWKSVGPTMVDIYSEKKKSTNELKDIDEAFSRWNAQLNQEVWESIKDEFAENNINLRNFSNGKEFTSTVSSYINDEIKNAGVKGDKEAEESYNNFVDSTWNEKIEPEWLPFLLDNQMLSEENEDSIDVLMASWRDTVYPEGFNWLFIVLGVIVLAVIIFLLTRRSSKSSGSGSVQTS